MINKARWQYCHFFNFFSKYTESEEDILNQVKLKPHNQETYDNLLEMLKTENRVACVQPTGTGKSYIALEFIEDHTDKQVLLLAPTDIILNQFKETVEEIFHKDANEAIMKNTTTAKYLDLSLKGFQYIFDVKWDVIIMDEFHRTGASVWNQFIDKLISMNPDAKLIGLSATPIRFLDDYRNMGEEIFHGNYACHYNVNDAWKRGILPIPKYVLTDYRITEGMEDYIRNRYPYATTKERIDWIVKQYLENGGNIHQILKEHLPSKNGKYIVFCSDSAHIRKMRPIVKGWLEPFNPKIHIYTTLSMDDEPDAELLAFKNDTSESIRLLFCVERLNEGLHLSDLDGEFMLRPTTSPIIYLQQMGRVLNSGSTEQPVIFDLVNNFSEYRRTVLRYRDMPEEEIKNLSPKERAEYNSYKEGKYDEFLEFDFVQKVGKICDLFDEIEIDLHESNWCEMYSLLKQYHEEFGRWPSVIEIYHNKKIGYWLQTQKRCFMKKKLSVERQNELESIGIDLSIMDYDVSWNEMFELVKQYHEDMGHWPKSKTFYCGKNIGHWVVIQKIYYRQQKLSIIREEKLKSIGFDFRTYSQIQWDINYGLLREYVEIFGKLPKKDTSYKNKNISSWIDHQRRSYKNGVLTEEQIKSLEELGVIFYKDKYYKSWVNMFELVKQYLFEFNCLPTGKTVYYKNRNLGNWLYRQTIKYKNNKLSLEQIKQLNEIGFIVDKASFDDKWNEMFELVKQYHEETGEWPKQKEVYKEKRIGRWLREQKMKYKQGSLSLNHIQNLQSIGYLVYEKYYDKRWKQKYKLVRQYYNEIGQWPKKNVVYQNERIGAWLLNQKCAYRKGKLLKSRQIKLESIGVVFDDNKKDQKN